MPREEGRTLSPTDVAHHLACQHRTQLERQRRDHTLQVAFAPDARLEAMKIRGLAHERAYLEQLRAQGKRIVDLTGNRDPERTLAAMQDGAEAIVQAALGDGAFFGYADVLLRCAVPSALGAHSYEPVDSKLAAETKAGALLQLLTYCQLLHRMQGTAPATFYVVTPKATEPYRTADYAAYHRVIRDHLLATTAATPPPATYPEPVPHCDVCAYWKFCADRRSADDHPSCIAGIQRGHVRELQRQHLPTLTAFANAGGLPGQPTRGRTETYARLAHQARLQLQAKTTGTVPVERLPLQAGRGLFRLPEPSPGDVFLDFEGDPFVGNGGIEYLTGYCYCDAHGKVVYQALWALDAAAEQRALETFLDFVDARRRSFPELHVYHFAPYEPAALRRLCARHDTRGPSLDQLLRGQRFIDLHAVVREAFRIGVDSYGLKPLEAVIGFARQLDLRVAGVARRDLELALELAQPAELTAERRQLVADYNRDDCLATLHLRDWLERQLAAAIEAGAAIPRPQLGVPEAKEEQRAHELRLTALRTALTKDLPEAAQRTGEQRALALLGDLVGYFARETKSAWWEHFRLREIAPDERVDEREMLAGLRFIGTEPRVGRETSTRCSYEFPPQDTAVDLGNSVYLPQDEDAVAQGVGTSLGTIAAFDLVARRVVIKQGPATAALRPSAVFRDQVVPNTALEKGLLAFAEHVRDHGLPTSGRFARAADLLLRRSPVQVPRQPNGALPIPGEPLLDTALRLCRELGGGVLPIQGPPGTGKSFTGGHMIEALVRTGHRVGITAVSHKVIDNLFAKTLEAATKTGSPLRCVHKHDQTPPAGITYTDDNDAALGAIGKGTVVGGTAWLWARDAAADALDYLFVDEAGQMSLAQVLAFARAAKNLVLLGDPQQLEQPHQGTHPDGADVAALTHLLAGHATLADHQGLFLRDTWRLHPTICAFTSELYYEGRLLQVAGAERQRLDGTRLGELRGNGVFPGAGLFLTEVPHDGNQASAPEEVEAIAALAERILRPGATWTDRTGAQRPLGVDDVLVIAPYNAQVGALRRRLQPLGITKVGTVDKFQGQEAPIVLYSCTSSSPADAPRGLAFLYDPHRLNVATSRARCAFVMVASPALFTAEVRSPEQMRQANGMCRFRELALPLALPGT